jgi:hypothetical protein
MNKLPLFLALAIFAMLSACSDDKEAPSHSELCKKTPPTKECLAGKWQFEGVYVTQSDRSPDCPEKGFLELKANGDYIFTGGVNNQEVIGAWTLDGSTITATNLTYDVLSKSGTVAVSSAGNNIDITTTGGTESIFAHCTNTAHKIEKFTWDTRNN